MSPFRRRPAGLLAVVVASAAAVSACSSAPPPPCATAPVPHGVAIAVGARAHNPAPAWPDLREELDAVVRASEQGDGNQGVTLVRVDGRPSVGCVVTHDNTGNNPAAEAAAKEAFLATVPQRAAELRALEPESNPLEALGMAAAAAGPGGTVVLLDSGLQTVAPLDFREPGLLDADADRVAGALREAGMLPDLRDRTVVLAGVGYTAAPQAALGTSRRTHLVQLWERIATAGGAVAVRHVETPSTAPPVDGLPPVSPVPIPPADPLDLACDTTSILSDDGPVGFRAGSTDFVDDAAARRELRTFATWLEQNPDARGHVVGSIAHYGENSPQGLSADRAERVREMLVDLGADPGAVTAEGVGWGPFPTPSAPPGPSVDPLNRRVVIELNCP